MLQQSVLVNLNNVLALILNSNLFCPTFRPNRIQTSIDGNTVSLGWTNGDYHAELEIQEDSLFFAIMDYSRSDPDDNTRCWTIDGSTDEDKAIQLALTVLSRFIDASGPKEVDELFGVVYNDSITDD